MDTTPRPRIVSADKLDGDLLLSFDDGMCALFTASFLRDNLAHAKIVEDTDDDE
jgi:hypothetical protein